jgi:hypothetical protein
VLERARAVCSADLGAEHEGVAAVKGDGWLEVDGSRRLRHVISGETPYWRASCRCFRPAT